MSNAAENTDLIAHTKALEAAGMAIKLVMRVPAPWRCPCRGRWSLMLTSVADC